MRDSQTYHSIPAVCGHHPAVRRFPVNFKFFGRQYQLKTICCLSINKGLINIENLQSIQNMKKAEKMMQIQIVSVKKRIPDVRRDWSMQKSKDKIA